MIQTQEQFLNRMQEIYAEQLETARRKNTDYGGGRDPFANFKAAEALGISMIDAILVRMMDKMSRISTLKNQDPLVKNESIIDTCSDLSVYAVILRLIMENRIESRNVTKPERDIINDAGREGPLEEEHVYDLGLRGVRPEAHS